MNPEQQPIAFDVQTTLRYLTSKIAALEEQAAINIGRIAHFEQQAQAAQEAQKPEKLKK